MDGGSAHVETHWNTFRVLGDLSHTLSKIILIWAIHSNKSAEGVSLITQILYLVVFCARYLFMGWDMHDTFHTVWNSTAKVFYLFSSAYILFLMTRVYARTREREKAWRLAAYSAGPSLLLAPLVMLLLERHKWTFGEFCWVFSIMLESVCVLPQLLLLRQTTVPTVIDSYYLLALGSYRAFYLASWLVQAFRDKAVDPISVVFGIVQTAFYIDFAWVYWTRQRVKLRGGAIVDSDDLSKGWLVNRLLGPRGAGGDEEVEDGVANGAAAAGPGPGANKTQRNWGPRGISVSADDGTLESERDRERDDAHGLADPGAFEDDDDDDDNKSDDGRNNKRFTDSER